MLASNASCFTRGWFEAPAKIIWQNGTSLASSTFPPGPLCWASSTPLLHYKDIMVLMVLAWAFLMMVAWAFKICPICTASEVLSSSAVSSPLPPCASTTKSAALQVRLENWSSQNWTFESQGDKYKRSLPASWPSTAGRIFKISKTFNIQDMYPKKEKSS